MVWKREWRDRTPCEVRGSLENADKERESAAGCLIFIVKMSSPLSAALF